MSKKGLSLVKKHDLQTIRFIKTLLVETTAMLIRHGESKADAAHISKTFIIEVTRRLSCSMLYFKRLRF